MTLYESWRVHLFEVIQRDWWSVYILCEVRIMASLYSTSIGIKFLQKRIHSIIYASLRHYSAIQELKKHIRE